MDKITMKGMSFYGYHGVFPEENKLGQRYVVDAELHLPLDRPGHADALEETINYAEVCELIAGIVEGPPFKLIEAVAEHIASRVLSTYTGIHAITVRVHKPNPPVRVSFDGVSVEIHRKRA
ncbi:dihydroneopterin aldolase [Paenibacillus sp. UNCCL117]|uniref:dihydroneopterin aldolase n=1 Tax=unclassified Paenibacillus TaxID=185978 RepID=UPI00088715F9|nr:MULTISPECIES: dihydroneopterin aldolase [unclassified Paenibacillus]SDE54592.1 dihydroneopterin aldolase [Paenibacillus sp. cl123]SFW68235.1 dihydroneopterin aldolase [Paenibacillus sp. UNCCL117]